MVRILSGVQPTGNLHIGNYLGAIKNWVELQKDNECLFCIVDLHAITVPQDPAELSENILETAAAYIASGVDSKKAIIFQQSMVSGHAELAWLLNCITPIGWLNRMTQFKDKAGKNKEKAGLGLYAYPVLMAADILLYGADKVPVGDDQKQHLELTRDIAEKFNRDFSSDILTVPEPLITGSATRVMSLRDGSAKMSKSDPSDNSRISLSDDADTIAKKISKAKSDSVVGITYDEEKRPEVANLINIYCAFTGVGKTDAINEFSNMNFSNFKKKIAEAVVEHLAPITAEFNKLKSDKEFLHRVVQAGSEKANTISEAKLKFVKETMGLA